MKFFIFIVTLFISISSFSQSLAGKWKPVFFSMDTLARGDVKADTFYLNMPFLEEQFKDDKEPKASMAMMQMVMESTFKNFKELEEEYAAGGVYKETNTRTGRTKTGDYSYDEKNKVLKKKSSVVGEAQEFTVSWKNGLLVLTTELESGNGKKGKMEIIYEKI